MVCKDSFVRALMESDSPENLNGMLPSKEESLVSDQSVLWVIHKPCGQRRGGEFPNKPCLSIWREGLEACPRGQKYLTVTNFSCMYSIVP